MKTTPPPIPGTMKYPPPTSPTPFQSTVVGGVMAIAQGVGYLAAVALAIIYWPITVPLIVLYLLIKSAVAAGVRSGRGK